MNCETCHQPIERGERCVFEETAETLKPHHRECFERGIWNLTVEAAKTIAINFGESERVSVGAIGTARDIAAEIEKMKRK